MDNKTMEEFMLWDGHNLFIVVFLIIVVVALSCGLLGFICTRVLEDFYSEGIKPMFVFTRKIASGDQILVPVLPTKIIVTKPQDNTSLASVTDDSKTDNNLVKDHDSKQCNPTRKKSRRRAPSTNQSDSPSEEIIFSCDNSPLGSPTEKVYHWSKSNNYDYTGNTNDQNLTSNNFNKINNNTRVEVNSPLSLYSATMSNRCYSAPSRPHVNRTDTILYM